MNTIELLEVSGIHREVGRNIGLQFADAIHRLFKYRKPGPLGQVRVGWLCRRHHSIGRLKVNAIPLG